MGQEFFVKSDTLESKVRDLLPSQGGLGAGFDLSASTQIVPIVDLTESAEGSNVRADLQSALSFDTVTSFSLVNQTTTLVTNTGYFRVFGSFSVGNASSGNHAGIFKLNDGATDKTIYSSIMQNQTEENAIVVPFDFIVFLSAGDSLIAECTTGSAFLRGCTRQIADINGNLTNP